MTDVCCFPQPDSGVRMTPGTHLHGCTLGACRGCVACPRHTPARVALRAAAAARFPVAFDTEADR